MKQSIGLVLLQIVGIVLGLFSVFYIAGSLPPEVYAIVGIYTVISSFISVFSNTGFETHAIRNVLAWKEEKAIAEIKLIVTQSLVYRSILAIVLVIPMLVYALYISKSNFENQYFGLFVLMAFMSVFKAVNDSAALLLRSFNMYFAAALTNYSVNVFGKLIALVLFFKFGFIVYINFILFLPLIVTLPILFLLRKWIDFHDVFSLKMLKATIAKTKSFAFSGYISYLFNYLDQLLVSIFMSPEILGSFTVAKNLLNMAKQFIENIFDPIVQGLVKFKNDSIQLKNKLKKIVKIKNILLVASILSFPVILFFMQDLLELINLTTYKYLAYFISFIYLSQIFHIALKVKTYLISLFFPQSYYLKLTVIGAFLVITFFVILSISDLRLLFLHIALKNIIMFFYTNHLYSKYYTKYIIKL